MTEKQPDESTTREIRRRLVAVRRRRLANRLLTCLFFDLFLAVVIFAVFLLVDRLISTPLEPLWVFAGLVGTALLVSLVRGGLLGGTSFFRTAVIVDEALELRERVSSAVYLEERDGSPPGARDEDGWRRLVERDGARALAAVDARRAFPVKLPRYALWALIALAVTLSIPLLVGDLDLLGFRQSREAEAAEKELVDDFTREVQKTDEFEELKELTEKEEDPEMKEILDAMNQLDPEKKEQDPTGVDPSKEEGEESRKKAMAQFSKLEDLIKKKVRKGEFEELREFLDRSKLQRIDPKDLSAALQKALKSGDFEKASEELAKLREELRKLREKQKSGQLSKEDLAKMQRLSRELLSLSRNSSALSRLGKGLESMSMNLSAQDLAQLLQNMDQMDLDLESLAQLMKQMETLDQSLKMLKLAKSGLGKMHRCPNCGKPRVGKPGGT